MAGSMLPLMLQGGRAWEPLGLGQYIEVLLDKGSFSWGTCTAGVGSRWATVRTGGSAVNTGSCWSEPKATDKNPEPFTTQMQPWLRCQTSAQVKQKVKGPACLYHYAGACSLWLGPLSPSHSGFSPSSSSSHWFVTRTNPMLWALPLSLLCYWALSLVPGVGLALNNAPSQSRQVCTSCKPVCGGWRDSELSAPPCCCGEQAPC